MKFFNSSYLEKALGNVQAGLLPEDVEVGAESHRIFLQFGL